jgi:hypothetical protein
MRPLRPSRNQVLTTVRNSAATENHATLFTSANQRGNIRREEPLPSFLRKPCSRLPT